MEKAAARLDPILRPRSVFDPSDPETARIVALTLVAQERVPLAALKEFYEAGVYALYYRGDFEAYRPLATADHPLYVGKADPASQSANEPTVHKSRRWGRLNEHAKNISKATTTLNINAAERYLIRFFRPIWNSETKICYGLGKHGDDAQTREEYGADSPVDRGARSTSCPVQRNRRHS